MLEKEIERKVCLYAQKHGWLTYKFTSPARRSVPDRIMIAPGGKVFFVEFKRQHGKLTSGQEREIKRLIEHGVHAKVIYSLAEGVKFVDRWTPDASA